MSATELAVSDPNTGAGNAGSSVVQSVAMPPSQPDLCISRSSLVCPYGALAPGSGLIGLLSLPPKKPKIQGQKSNELPDSTEYTWIEAFMLNPEKSRSAPVAGFAGSTL